MATRVRRFVCEDCGNSTERRDRADRARVCLDCGIERCLRWAKRRSVEGQARRAVRLRQRLAATGG